MRIPRTATAWIAIVTVAIWLLIEIVGAGREAAFVMGFVPARQSALVDISPAAPVWLTPLTSTLVHANFMHIALNVIILLWCGSLVERVLGKAPLLIIYMLGAYVAALAQWLMYPTSILPMVGASGSISAVIGAFALSFGQQKQIVRSPGLNRFLNSLWLLAAWIVVQLMVAWMAGTRGILIATPAHVGGFIAGILLQRPLLMWRYRSA